MPTHYQPATIVAHRTVKPGKETEFEEWIKGISAAASQFEGHIAVDVIKQQPDYFLIFRFIRHDQLEKWAESDIRKQWLERVKPLIVGETRLQILTGLEFWFTPPGGIMPAAPPRYKQAILTWLAITPLSLTINYFLQPVLQDIPLVLRASFISGLLVILMAYYVMPTMTRLFAPWLFKK